MAERLERHVLIQEWMDHLDWTRPRWNHARKKQVARVWAAQGKRPPKRIPSPNVDLSPLVDAIVQVGGFVMNPLKWLDGAKTYLGGALVLAAGGYLIATGAVTEGIELIGIGIAIMGGRHALGKGIDQVRDSLAGK